MNFYDDFFKNNKINVIKNYNTSKISAIKAGGIADRIVFPENLEKFISIVSFLNDNSVEYKVIGNCSNTVFSDEGYKGCIISTKFLDKVAIFEDIAEIECGGLYSRVALELLNFNVLLLPELCGIPGSIGGMVKNNAGAFGSSISDSFVYGFFYDINSRKTIKLHHEELRFSYRYSILHQNNYLLLKAGFRFEKGNTNEFLSLLHKYRELRRSTQPSFPSLGSFYKRDGEIIPAKIIQDLGLKGYFVGGAQISDKHAGFIVNRGNATFKDILNLAEFIEEKVFENFKINLKREAELVF